MSKRVPYPRRIVSTTLALFAIAFSLSTFASGIALAARPLISIEHVHCCAFQGSTESVDITYEPNGSSLRFAGFDLLIGYDAGALSLIDVARGDLLTNCGWQYFTYRTGSGACNGNCPSGVLRVVAVGDIPAVAGPALCNLGQTAGTLVTMNFLVTAGRPYEWQDLPLQFYWNDCADNILSAIAGDTTFVSDTVFWGEVNSEYYPAPGNLSTVEGWPESCFPIPGGSNGPVRAINFWHGLIGIGDMDSSAIRGDLNLNGLPYEIADAVVFVDYFLYGLAAFNPNPGLMQNQIDASDANANGVPLEYRDLIYILRIITGDAQPIPKLTDPADTLAAVFTQNTESKSVSVQYSAPLAGAYLVFVGEVTPSFLPAAPGNFIQSSSFENGLTRVLLAGTEPSATPGTIWFNYTGSGMLQSVETTDFDDTPIDVQILFQNATAQCGDVNHDSHINISDIVAMIGVIFGIWPGQVDPALADVDCSGTMTISDVVYLLQYIFAAGNAPCANCP